MPGTSSGLTREHWAGDPLSYSALLRVGFTEPARSPGLLVSSYLTVSPLPSRDGGLLSVALVRGVSPPGRYPAPCPAEPGLSSRRVAAAGDHPAFSGAIFKERGDDESIPPRGICCSPAGRGLPVWNVGHTQVLSMGIGWLYMSVAPAGRIERAILLIRGEEVILDATVARLYCVTVGRLNEAVRRNRDRFPPDFMFQLTKGEFESLRARGTANLKSQFATSSSGWGGRRTPPYAFTRELMAPPGRKPRQVGFHPARED